MNKRPYPAEEEKPLPMKKAAKNKSTPDLKHNMEVTRRFCLEVWGGGNADIADELMATDLIDHTPFPSETPGLEGHKQTLAIFRNAFPDLTTIVDDVMAEGDLTFLLWHGEATHSGVLIGIPPTGRHVNVTGMDILRLKNGKIIERWAEVSALQLMQQIGAIPGG
jgi:predicted ester cyclase